MTEQIGEILQSLSTPAAKAIRGCGLLSLWNEVVDERVRKQTEPVKISNRTLYVSTATSAWAQELSFLRKEIVSKFNRRAGEEVIRDIKFRAGLREE